MVKFILAGSENLVSVHEGFFTHSHFGRNLRETDETGYCGQ